jgi:hypothetical protein
MKAVQGFLTEDDTFFDDKHAAELYEAELELRLACDKPNIDDDKLIDYLITLQPQIQRYFNALEKHNANNGKAEEVVAPEQQQSPRSDEPVPDVGRRTRPKRVRD